MLPKSKNDRKESLTYFWVVTYLEDIANDFSMDYLRMETLLFVNHVDKSLTWRSVRFECIWWTFFSGGLHQANFSAS